MPAHNAPNKDKEFEMHVLVVEKGFLGKVPDGHARIKFEWHGSDRTWRIEGIQAPESPFLDSKHNWNIYESGLPKGQGEAILRLLEWVQGLSSNV